MAMRRWWTIVDLDGSSVWVWVRLLVHGSHALG